MDDSVLTDAILNGLVSDRYHGNRVVGPQLLTNNHFSTIWQVLRQELMTCRHFTWVVAFITTDMLVPFKVVMADLAKSGVQGTIITSDYLGFNRPQALAELMKIPNLTVKIAAVTGLHAKGYLFDHGDYQTMVIGSANFTRAALLVNKEWSVKLSSRHEGAFFKQVAATLTDLEQSSIVLNKKWLADYRSRWQAPPVPIKSRSTVKKVVPNKMQTAALHQLQELVASGAHRGLVVSATGTGKTYLGAFAVKAFRPQRFLYVVHREQIARKALASFKRVIGGSANDFGLLTGNQRDINAKYLFATVQTLSQPANLQLFRPAEFDYILVDEAHRAAAPSYRRVLDYFMPKFWLGMTATPERMDKQDVFKIFDYHLAYEIRLKDALTAGMLTPFHYVGVEDYTVDDVVIDETTKLNQLAAPMRVQYVLDQLDYYGYCGDTPRGLVFCSRQEEARAIAKQFSAVGHPAVALTNQDSDKQRARAVAKLEAGKLEYIVTVDLFNEGVDIPSLNQIVMMRNTQSATVFIQQLGRGLRKYPGKNFVTVIDFIGNYKHNYLIPLALNQDNSRRKDVARRETKLPVNLGVSTINFSRVATKRILAALDNVKLDSMRELRQAYIDLAHKLGRVPLLLDFYKYGSVAPIVFAQHPQLAHYGHFLIKMGEKLKISKYESQVLSFVTKELLNGKRPHELVLLKLLLTKGKCSVEEYLQALRKINARVTTSVIQSVDNVLSLRFFAVKAGKHEKRELYGTQPIVVQPNLLTYQLNSQIQAGLKNEPDFKKLLMDVVLTGLELTTAYDPARQFTLYKQYDRKDVCRLLDWPLDVSAPMYGYRVADNVCPIFITYHKDSQKKRNAVYNNQLQDGRSLRWYTRSPRHITSAEVQKLLAGLVEGKPEVQLHLFVKQSDAIGKEFYYLGPVQIETSSVKEELIGPKHKPAVGMNLVLDHPLPLAINELLAMAN